MFVVVDVDVVHLYVTNKEVLNFEEEPGRSSTTTVKIFHDSILWIIQYNIKHSWFPSLSLITNGPYFNFTTQINFSKTLFIL